MTALVTGAGGAIGGHLVKRLLNDGDEVRAIDIKPLSEWWQAHPSAENIAATDVGQCADKLVHGIDTIYHLAEDMGGVGFITSHHLDCSVSVVPSIQLIRAAITTGVQRLFFSSSACIYRTDLQDDPNCSALKENDAFPALPERGYGEAKLYVERVCQYAYEDYGLETRVARYHNVYGPHGAFDGGREKAPAALCRKIAIAAVTGNPEIEVWGDGRQTRTFMYVSDCTEGTLRIMRSDCRHPLNLGTADLISMDDLALLIAEIAGVQVRLLHNTDAPQGVRGRSSENTMIKQVLGWEPSKPLREGLEHTYAWIYDRVKASL